MHILKKHFYKKQFGDVLGYNSGISLIGPPLMTAWCYLLDGVLIDSGIRHLRPAILGAVREDKPDVILITHHHEDHSGNVAAIRNALGIPAFAHPLTVDKMRAPFKIRPYQHLMWGQTEPVALAVHALVHEFGKSRFRPIHTPGHSQDHTVYLEENRGYLFSGDLFLGERIKFFRADETMGDQLASLKSVLRLDFDVLFCAHRPLMQNGKQALRNKLDFLENFCATIQALKDQGMSLKAVVRHLDRHEDRLVKWLTLKNACFANMVRSAYLLTEVPAPELTSDSSFGPNGR
ncbi:MAG: MBL fold metallo-hydrolase [Desulfobacterales bacterium]|nr:MBL fold metallo-hydrolase [Desulfobacterales bacterium]